jgi:catechol 2,3-dioxygenase-like lactoylglutathione lyase family enzyme
LTASQQLTQGTAGVLAESRLVAVTMYVHDLAESREFYERKVGLRPLYIDDSSVQFDAGMVVLSLRLASEDGVTLAGYRDEATDTVFMVDDIAKARTALEARGIEFFRNRTYEIGQVTDFYDPNGHRLMLYQPSDEALSWPSADKLRGVWRTAGRGGADLIGPAADTRAETVEDLVAAGLDGKPLVYLFLFVDDAPASVRFYHETLGMRALERAHCCNESCPEEEHGEEEGIVKYDAGGVLLSTHHLHGGHVVLDDAGQPYSPREFDASHVKGVAPVFHTYDVYRTAERLRALGVTVHPEVRESWSGKVAAFEDPAGHVCHLYEPSPQAAALPTGARMDAILAAGV